MTEKGELEADEGNMEAEEDNDDGTFTNISLADDPGEAAIRFYSSYYFESTPPTSHNKISH